MKTLTDAEIDFELRDRYPAIFVELAEKDREIKRLRASVKQLRYRNELIRIRARAGRQV